MVLPLCPTLAVGFITLVVWYIVTRWQQRKRYPPGPFPLPLIGNALDLVGSKAWPYLLEQQKKYGDTFTLFMATQPTVVLSSIESVREAFITKQNDFAGRPDIYSFEIAMKGSKDIVSGQFGPVWRQQRKIAHSAIRKFATGDFLTELVHNSFNMSAIELDKRAEDGKSFDPKHPIEMIIYNVMASMVFGKTFEHNDPTLTKIIDMMDEFDELFGNGIIADVFPVFKHLPLKSNKILLSISKDVHKIIEDLYDEHKKNFDEDNPRDIVDYFLKGVQDLEKEEGKEATKGLTEVHYQMLIVDVFLAGTNTTRYTLAWSVLHLAAFPECQKKLQEEVDEVLGPDTEVTTDYRSKLPHIEAFLYEVLRMRPVAPLALPHVTMADTSVGGHAIPAGTTIMPNLMALHMNKEAWGDPEAFRPERFLDKDGKMGPHISSWMPFSSGRRVCVGEALAKANLIMVMASLIQRYEFSAPAGMMMNLRPKDVAQFTIPDDNELVIKRRK